MYQDENGEWVLAEADGAGCIFNFTQHRYPTSEVPTFRFYFDNSPIPQFELTPADFGKKTPFLSPLADIFIGPEDAGKGPIWVVRSFVPMEFCTHCKVTSTVKLEGCEKIKGEGGWGHVIMQLYDNADSLSTFDASKDISPLAEIYRDPLCIEATHENCIELELAANQAQTALILNGKDTLCCISAAVQDFLPELLSQLFIHIEFDGKQTVCAPFGTFFGCEYGKAPARLDTALLTWDILSSTAFFENRYPMPFFENCRITVENRSDNAVKLQFTVKENRSLCYDKAKTGIFTSSEYYPITPNTMGKNSVIAEVSGHGQMVYGVVSGDDIRCGCEGDVRIFIDGLNSPSVESDGTESWGSYGWGFVVPPQCNPFSAYNGLFDSNDFWSELRLTFTDCYPFRSRLRFELEHGCQNDGGGTHSGQIFCYMQPKSSEKLMLEITPENEYYITDGKLCTVKDRFENGIHENYATFTQNTDMTYSRFSISLPKMNMRIVLKRVSLQNNGRTEATVFINGNQVSERNWLYPDFNNDYRLLEDSFTVPTHYTRAQTQITIEIKPLDSNWNECRYRIFASED